MFDLTLMVQVGFIQLNSKVFYYFVKIGQSSVRNFLIKTRHALSRYRQSRAGRALNTDTRFSSLYIY